MARLKPYDRYQHLLSVAVFIAETEGLANTTRQRVAEAANVSPALVSAYFSMTELRDMIMQVAVEKELLNVIAEGLATNSYVAKNAPSELKEKALRWIGSQQP